MRKLIWSCVGAGTLAAGGLFWAGQHACQHPDSLTARCLVAAAGIASALTPVGQALLTTPPHSALAAGHVEAGAEEVRVPDDPVPVPEPVAQAGASPAPADNQVWQGGMSLPAGKPPAHDRELDPIVIREDEPIHAEPLPELPVLNQVSNPYALPGGASPRVMPYCHDDAVRHMPYAAEGEESEATAAADQGPQNDSAAPVGGETVSVPTPDGETTASPADEGKDESSYHRTHSDHSYTVCPYTGRCYPNPPCTQPAPMPMPGSEETSEQPPATTPRSYRKIHPRGADAGEERPAHSDVDTMEFRPSDGSLGDLGQGPL